MLAGDARIGGFGGFAKVQVRRLPGRDRASAAHARAETGKGFGTCVATLGIRETVALSVIVFFDGLV